MQAALHVLLYSRSFQRGYAFGGGGVCVSVTLDVSSPLPFAILIAH